MRKPLLEGHPADMRRVYPVDEIRVRAWYRFVADALDLKTPYAMAREFGGQRKKWKNYLSGGQPNEHALDQVDAILAKRGKPGAKSLFLDGPAGLHLWIALEYEDEQRLESLSKYCTSVDRDIAALKLLVAGHPEMIDEDFSPVMGTSPAFEERFSSLVLAIHEKLEPQLAAEVVHFLTGWFCRQIEEARKRCEQYVQNFSISSPHSDEEIEEMKRQVEFEGLQLKTVGQKGRRKDTE